MKKKVLKYAILVYFWYKFGNDIRTTQVILPWQTDTKEEAQHRIDFEKEKSIDMMVRIQYGTCYDPARAKCKVVELDYDIDVPENENDS